MHSKVQPGVQTKQVVNMKKVWILIFTNRSNLGYVCGIAIFYNSIFSTHFTTDFIVIFHTWSKFRLLDYQTKFRLFRLNRSPFLNRAKPNAKTNLESEAGQAQAKPRARQMPKAEAPKGCQHRPRAQSQSILRKL